MSGWIKIIVVTILAVAACVAGGCGRKRPSAEESPDNAAPAAAEAPLSSSAPGEPIPIEPDNPLPVPDPLPNPLDDLDQAIGQQEYDYAIVLFRLAIDRRGEDVDLLKGMASMLLAADRDTEAAAVCHRILQQEPDNTTAQFNLAVAYIRMGQYYEAEAPLRRVLDKDPDNSEARYNLAAALQAQSKLNEARDVWEALAADENAPPDTHVHLGVVLMELTEFDTAFARFQEAVKLAPDDCEAWVNLAAAARATRSYGYAVVALKRATELRPNDAAIWADLGNTLLGIYRRDADTSPRVLPDAMAALRRSLELDPIQPDVRKRIEEYGPLVPGG